MIRAALALLVVAAASAADFRIGVDQPDQWYRADVSHHGKHGTGGVVIGAALYVAAVPCTDDRADRYLTALAGGALIGVGYEVATARHGGTLIDPVDAAWVTGGALVGAAIADLTHQAITVIPRSDGAELAIAWRF